MLARFGGILYWMFAMLQLTLMLFFAPLFTAAAVSYEKDRRTFTLLLDDRPERPRDRAGQAGRRAVEHLDDPGGERRAAVDLCVLRRDLVRAGGESLRGDGGVGRGGGALGLLIALWRDRTFQSISLTILMVVFSVAGVEAFAIVFPTLEFMGVPLVEVLNPYRAMLAVLYPEAEQLTGVVRAIERGLHRRRLTFAAALVAFGTWKLRKWNPGKNEPRELREEGGSRGVETLIEVDEEAGRGVGRGRSATVRRVRRRPSARSAVAIRRGRRPSPRRPSRTARGRAAGRAGRRPPGCTSRGGPTAGSAATPSRIASPGPTRSSGASS